MKGVTEENGIYNINRFTYIEPNEFASYYNLKNSAVDYRGLSWNPEDLSISVDLQVIIPNRGDKGQVNYTTKIDEVVVHSNGSTPLANYISYLGGTKLSQNKDDKSFLTDNYTNISFGEMKDGKYVDKESLGISSIDINFDAHFFPIVTINFTDVRGSSLFMPSEYNFDKSVGLVDDNSTDSVQSFFSALFHFPYPRFLLSVKGFYGNKVTFQLAVSDFKSSLKPESGDYDITVQFIGYVYGLYTDLPLNLVLASPYFNEEYWNNKVDDGTFKYVSSSGGVGNGIIPYVKFLTLVNEKNINTEALGNNTNVKDFLLKKNKIKSLEKILNIHNRLSKDKTSFITKTFEGCVGNKYTFMYKIVDETFILNENLSKEYYDEIRNYLNTFDDPYYLDSGLNPYYKNLLSSVGGDVNLIKNDTKYEYLEKFETFTGIRINEYFDVDTDTGKINSVKDRFKTETNGDDILKAQYIDVDFANVNKTLMPSVYAGLIVNHYDYSNFLTTEIENLRSALTREENEIVEDLGKVFEDIIGFSPTVENFYRMLFAHIDCFMDYFYTKVLDKITDATNKGERTINYLGVPIDSLDMPKSLIGSNDKNKDEFSVFPFPGYFTENLSLNGSRMVATYPGESSSQNFRNIREVSCVDEIHKGTELLGTKMNEFLANQNINRNNYSTANLSILSVLYGGTNPWSNIKIDNSNGDNYNLLKILYYFAYQVLADKFIGLNTINNGNKTIMSDEYIDRQVEAFLFSGQDIREEFVNYIKTIKNYNSTDNRRKFLKSENSKNFNLYDRDQLFSSINGDNNILLTLDEDVLVTPNKELTNTQKDEYYIINKNDSLNFISKDKKLELNNNTIENESLKNLNSSLLKINNAGEYLGGGLNFGKWCVSLLKDSTDAYELDDNTIIHIVSINSDNPTEWVKDEKAYVEHMTNQDTNTYNSLIKYYNDDVKENHVFFVGTKKANDGLSGFGNPNGMYFKDDYSSRNIFSGIKSIPNKYSDYDEYKPLIQTNRFEVHNFSLDENKYAFATYFLSLLCGGKDKIGALGKILDVFKGKTLFTPVRKVDLLYLGGSLYFAFNGNSKWNPEGGEKKIAELTFDGELGSGLLGDAYNKRKQTLYSIENFTDGTQPNNLGQKLITNFENWCNNELFGGKQMYTELVKIPADNDDYFTLSGFVTNVGKKYNTSVQGYTKTSKCSKWLTDLVYDYEFVYSVGYGYSGVKNIGVDIDNEVWKFLIKLSNKLEEQENAKNKEANNENIVTDDDNKIEIKRALYYTLKNLYDKWLCGYCHDEFKLNPPDKDLEFRKQRFCQSITETNSKKIKTSEYNNFVYVDQFFNDISSKYMMDVDTISKKLVEIYTGNKNIDIYSFMSFMAEKNKLMLIALPVYNNMYNAKSIASVFTPNTLYSVNNYDNSNGIGTTYVVMYASEVSHQSELYQGYEYCRDYPDLAGVATNQQPVDIKLFNVSGTNENSKLNYDVSAFAVSYSKQNQMYFKNINVSMDNPKITDESTRNLLALSEGGSQGDINQPITIGQNIYSIYSNRSYTCTVEMMGCANITPLMYFQLNNIPMFRGLYMIISVKHSIKAGDMTTVFTGVRVSRYSLPDLSRAILNSSIFGKLESSNAWKDGKAIGGDNPKPNNISSTKYSNKWLECVEGIGKWYQNNIHTYVGAPSTAKTRTGRKYYDCPLIGNSSVADDCSSFVTACLRAFGIGELDKLWPNTSSMQPGSEFARIITQHGFTQLPYNENEIKKGDIIIGGASSHTEIYWGDKKSFGWGNIHDNLLDIVTSKQHLGMPCWKAKVDYKTIYRYNA